MKETLTPDQEKAENLIAEWFFNTDDLTFVLAGYAGTGKTFLINHVVKNVLHLQAGKEAAFVSPTGKAATVLAQGGTVAGTVHGLIYIRNEDDFDVDENGEIIEKERLSFYKRDQIDESIRLIVVDEASMVNEEMLRDLLSFGVKCLFCGDHAQLPPVSGTCPLLSRPNYALTQIVRQAADNPIIKVATMAREGKDIPFGNFGDRVSVISRRRLTGDIRKRVLTAADQVICGRNKTRTELNGEIRGYLGVPEGTLLPTDGEKLICTLNNWEKPLDAEERFHLVNGIIGRVRNIEEQMDLLATMDFKADRLGEEVGVIADTGIFQFDQYAHGYGDQAVKLTGGAIVHEHNKMLLRRVRAVEQETICRFEFAYAITCHKAQGSEFDNVVVFDESWVFGEERHRWLYTAITRAKERLLIVR
ncbi:MAG: AAA family ATPase [Clostridia bacterium]|nr:AAA family ATPase [Clostridia bacterium]